MSSRAVPLAFIKAGDLPKNKLIDQFKTDLHSVLFATTSYWEGVDVPGGLSPVLF